MRPAGRAFSRRLFWHYGTAVEVQQLPIDAPLATRLLDAAEIAFAAQDLTHGAQPLHAAELTFEAKKLVPGATKLNVAELEFDPPGLVVGASPLHAAELEFQAQDLALGAQPLRTAELDLVAPGLGMALPTGLAELVIEPQPMQVVSPLSPAELVIEPRPLRAVLTLGVASVELEPRGLRAPLSLEPAPLSFEAVPLYISTGETIITLAPAEMDLVAMPMAAVFINKQRVYEAICAAVAGANFYPVTYDPTNCMIAVADSSLAVRPASIVLNEVVSTHRPAMRHRRKLTFERDRWVWELILKFNQEVSVEDFENKVLDEGLLIPADPSRNLPQIRVELEESPYEHPPQGQPSNGTTVRFTLNARVHHK